jgi:YegS/Rv2252/BmrU family lipid kinase
MDRSICFIINPAAGAARRWSAFARALDRHGIIAAEHIITRRPGEAASLAQKLATKHDVLAAVGGDGTVCEVANGILFSGSAGCALAIVPAGTGNDAAVAVGIQSDGDALGAIATGQSRSIDVIEVRCHAGGKPMLRYALLFAGVGIVSESLKQTTPLVKRLFGQRFSYPIGVLRALAGYHPRRMRVTFEGQTIERPFLFVAVSNTERAGGGMKIAPGARPDDGVLNLTLVEEVGRWEAITQLRALCHGEHIHRPFVRYFPGHALSVDAQAPLEVAADGDLIGHTPAQFSVKPKALQVLVP